MKRYVLAVLAMVFLAGCGGGNGSDESGSAPANTGSAPASTIPGAGQYPPAASADPKRWPHSFGQFSEIFKWNVRGNHAADLIAGSVAKYASSGVRSARLEWGRFRLYKLMYSPMERRAWLTDSYAFR